jgi:hypothetical protein
MLVPPITFSLSSNGNNWKNLSLEHLINALLLEGRSINLSNPNPWMKSYMRTVE